VLVTPATPSVGELVRPGSSKRMPTTLFSI